MMRRIQSSLRRMIRREDGTATVEFVFVVPVVLTIFMASVEAGFFMAKHVMMERGLDIVMRDLRLGRLGAINHDDLRDLICEKTPILKDCSAILKVEMTRVSMATFAMPNTPATCVDRGLAVQPDTNYELGAAEDFMVVRICAVQDPIFPSTGIGLQLREDAQGGYQMVAASTFVIEPS